MKIHAKVDTGLVAKARAADKDALGKLYDLFVERIYRFVYARVGNREDAEDVTEQVFVKVVTNIGRYQERGFPFEAWLFRIVRNQVTDFYRQKKVAHLPLEHAMYVIDPKPLPDEQTITKMQYEEVLEVLPDLPESYQDIILLKFVSEMNNDEISVIMGKPIDQVRVLQSRAIAKLKILMKL